MSKIITMNGIIKRVLNFIKNKGQTQTMLGRWNLNNCNNKKQLLILFIKIEIIVEMLYVKNLLKLINIINYFFSFDVSFKLS